jgi:hypothetical protein
MASIEEILAIEHGNRVPGATDEDIADAEHRIGVVFPVDYRAFLRWSNGWSGDLLDWPLILDGTEDLPDRNDVNFQEFFPGYLAIGGNGGLETYAVRLDASGAPSGVVAIDRNSSDSEDVWPIAPTIAAALARLRIQPLGPWESKEEHDRGAPGLPSSSNARGIASSDSVM